MTPQKAMWILAACLVGFQLFFRYDHWRLDDGRRAEYDALTGRTLVLEKGQKRSLVQWLTGGAPRSAKLSRLTEDEDTMTEAPTDSEGVAMFQQADEDKPRLKGGISQSTRWEDPDAAKDQAREAARETEWSARKRSTQRAFREAMLDEPETARSSATKRATSEEASTRQATDKPAAPRKAKAAHPPVPDDADDQLAFVPPPSPRLLDAHRPLPVTAGNDLNRDGANEQIIQSPPNANGVIDFAIVSHGRELFYGKGQQLRVLTTRHKGWADVAVVKPNDQVEVFRYVPESGNYEPINQTGE